MATPGHSPEADDSVTQAAQRAITDGYLLAMELQAVAATTHDPKLAALCLLMAKHVDANNTLAHVVLRRQAQQETLVKATANTILGRLDEAGRPWWQRWFT